MSVVPIVRHLLACKKEPTMIGADPSAHDILYAISPKAPFQYPIWLRSFYLFAMVCDGQGLCTFHAEMRLVELDPTLVEVERLVGRSKSDSTDLGGQPLQVRFLSVQMSAVLLPKPGVYRVYLVTGKNLAATRSTEVIHEKWRFESRRGGSVGRPDDPAQIP